MDKKQIWNSGYWILVILLLVLAHNTLLRFSQVQSVHYSDFENATAQRLIPEVMVSDRIITGQFKVPDGGKTMLAQPGSERAHKRHSEGLQYVQTWITQYSCAFSTTFA
jgi:hypothetical protein